MTERLHVGYCILAVLIVIAVLGAVLVSRAEAHPVFVRWEQPDYLSGDTWEIQWTDCTVMTEWSPLIPMFPSTATIWATVLDPQVDCTAVARTWRDGEVSVDSAPRIYVPEPPRWLLLAAGVPLLFMLSGRREERPRSST